MRRKVTALLLCLFALQQMFCTPEDSPVAGGSEGGNARVLGAAMYVDSMPVVNAVVQLRSADYLFGDTALQGVGGNVRTNAQGEFAFDSIVAGEYRIAIYSSEGIGAFVECHVPSGASEITLESALLDSLSSLEGVVDGPGIVGRECRIRPYGLDKKARFESATGRYFLDSMPYGRHALNVRGPSERYGAINVEDLHVVADKPTKAPSVRIGPTVNDSLTHWQFHKRIVLNTTDAGVRITERLFGFPLLVSLSDENFDFSLSAPHGEDVRFVNKNGGFLPHEIEKWDDATNEAVVWVRTDTIEPDNDTQYISMYWGNPQAISLSDGASVFDTANGYSGVWHLAQNENPDFFADATMFRNDAARLSDGGTVVGATGIIDQALQFPRNYYAYLSIPDNPSLRVQSFTFSAWFRRDIDNDATYPVIISKQNWLEKRGYIFGFVHKDSISMVSRLLSGVDTKTTSIEYIEDTFEEWVHVAGAYDGERMRLYSNGAIAADSVVGPVDILHDDTHVQIGRAFKGILDEVRISRIARSSEWIKLMYENQRPGQKLVTLQ